MSPELLTATRELHSRRSGGALVRLLWCASDSRVYVTVNDHHTGEAFSVRVPEGEAPMQVFQHPYAYAAWAGGTGDAGA